ncbi:hypothetical protein ACJRPK_13920 [Aquimarina sp. 2-A2]|uniref:hypothetical protein n=1 Tax=Aquimarina sp. 2-A2 TaxID=3382644 RepID=UPI00387F2AA4
MNINKELLTELVNKEFNEGKNLSGTWEGYEVEEHIEEIHNSLISKLNPIEKQLAIDATRLSLLEKIKEIAFGDGSTQERMVDIKALFTNEA